MVQVSTPSHFSYCSTKPQQRKMTTLRVVTMHQVRLMEPLQAPTRYCRGAFQLLQPAEEEDPNPILLRPTPCSYDTVFATLSRLNFDPKSVEPCKLPPGLVKRVLSFLTVKCVKPEEVEATNCSSHDGIHPLPFCLLENETSWWLSSHGTMPGGRGQQWVQFQLSRNLRRLSSVSLKIPPLPQGPLSVREFCLRAFHLERGWYPITPVFQLESRSGWQTFIFEGVDVDEVRLVCFSNQMEEHITSLRPNSLGDENIMAQLQRFESVGFFCVKFE